MIVSCQWRETLHGIRAMIHLRQKSHGVFFLSSRQYLSRPPSFRKAREEQSCAGIRGAWLQGHLTGFIKKLEAEIVVIIDGKSENKINSTYEDWEASDQQVLGYLLSSLSRDVLMQVATCDTAAEAWRQIEAMYSTHTRARSISTRFALSNARKR